MQAARGTPLTGPVAAGQQDPESDSPAGLEAAGQQELKADSPAGLEAGRQRWRVALLLAVAVAVLGLDIATKIIVVATLSDRAPIRLLGGFLHLREDRNPGAAFSFAPSMTILFSLIAITVIVVILRSASRIKSTPWAVTLGLLLGGATGNLVDRIFRYPGLFRGWVVDWIQIPHWPVFNLADSAIVCGGILAVLLSVRGIRLDGQRESR